MVTATKDEQDQPEVLDAKESTTVESNQDKDELVACQEKCQEWEEKYKRALADYQNLERRTAQERKAYIALANRELMEQLLEPLDFMGKAVEHVQDKGVQMVIDRFHAVLAEQGLEEMNIKIGDKFDESTMEVIETVAGDENKVVEIRRKGYRLNGTVIRYAQVVTGTRQEK